MLLVFAEDDLCKRMKREILYNVLNQHVLMLGYILKCVKTLISIFYTFFAVRTISFSISDNVLYVMVIERKSDWIIKDYFSLQMLLTNRCMEGPSRLDPPPLAIEILL